MTSLEEFHAQARAAAQTGNVTMLNKVLKEVGQDHGTAAVWNFSNLYLEATNMRFQANLMAGRKLNSASPPPHFLCPDAAPPKDPK